MQHKPVMWDTSAKGGRGNVARRNGPELDAFLELCKASPGEEIIFSYHASRGSASNRASRIRATASFRALPIEWKSRGVPLEFADQVDGAGGIVVGIYHGPKVEPTPSQPEVADPWFTAEDGEPWMIYTSPEGKIGAFTLRVDGMGDLIVHERDDDDE